MLLKNELLVIDDQFLLQIIDKAKIHILRDHLKHILRDHLNEASKHVTSLLFIYILFD